VAGEEPDQDGVADQGAFHAAARDGQVDDPGEQVRHLVKAASQPGFTADSWAPLAEFVATGEFERVGTWLEVMDWQQYTEFMTQ
jgi:hypothetical protein